MKVQREASPLRDYERHVLQLVEEKAPKSILAVGVDGEALFAPYLRDRDERTLTRLGTHGVLDQLGRCGRYGFGLVADALEHLPKDEGSVLLARMRDLHTERFCILVPIESPDPGHQSVWRHTELIAYGLTLLARYQENGQPFHLYGFDIASYKSTPDWLNPRYWAHPELWDKYRW
ncbi:MAG: hypothetical protein GWN84_20295 [Gammaproteobacteria bacterium]|nr:hypothetical protein [Gammaproteobacteria bacterium]NIR83640.1 hypothetical protein [Gammaproteobacteria bacterium]NIR91613.1 hypothetical protein [Gammaproteobacteria bacterium]NIU04802.1 hypothetical protein [Gammaproteobacteria bacterium]NIV53152.1 hypothetical protein [Gammaproteobacteria bacterium]